MHFVPQQKFNKMYWFTGVCKIFLFSADNLIGKLLCMLLYRPVLRMPSVNNCIHASWLKGGLLTWAECNKKEQTSNFKTTLHSTYIKRAEILLLWYVVIVYWVNKIQYVLWKHRHILTLLAYHKPQRTNEHRLHEFREWSCWIFNQHTLRFQPECVIST